MALLYVDSMDHYSTADITEKWTTTAGTVAINATGGRRGSASLRVSAGGSVYALKGVAPSGTTAIVGVAFKASSLTNNRILGIFNGATNSDHVQLWAPADGSIAVYRAATTGPGGSTSAVLLGTTASGLLSGGTVAYLELKVVLHDTAGSVELRVNGAAALTLTNVDTANGAAVWSSMWLGNLTTTTTVDFDDLYVCDGTGPAPWNTFLGDCRVDARMPTGPGATTSWTPSAGANWQCVDDIPPNDDTDFTTAAAAGLTDTFVVQDAPVVNAIIYGVQHCLNAKKTDAGVASIAPVIRPSGTDFVGPDLSPSTAYGYLLKIAATNPETGTQWTEAQFNAADFGYRRTL